MKTHLHAPRTWLPSCRHCQGALSQLPLCPLPTKSTPALLQVEDPDAATAKVLSVNAPSSQGHFTYSGHGTLLLGPLVLLYRTVLPMVSEAAAEWQLPAQQQLCSFLAELVEARRPVFSAPMECCFSMAQPELMDAFFAQYQEQRAVLASKVIT